MLKILFNLNRRTLTGFIANRFTSSRRRERYARKIADLCQYNDVELRASKARVYVRPTIGETTSISNTPFAKTLHRTGFQSMIFKEGTTFDTALQTLKALSFNKLKTLNDNPDLSFNWTNLYQEIVYQDSHPVIMGDGTRFMYAGGIAGMAFALIDIVTLDCFNLKDTIAQSELKFWLYVISCALVGTIGSIFIPHINKYIATPIKRPIQYLARQASFKKDWLATTSFKPKNIRRLARTIKRMNNFEMVDTILDQKVDIEILRQSNLIAASYLLAKHPQTSEAELAKLLENPDKKVRKAIAENLLIRNYLKAAEESFSVEELRTLAEKPFPCVRFATLENPNTPWEKVAEILAEFKPYTFTKIIPAEKWYAALVCPLGDKGMPEREVEVKCYPPSVTEKVIDILAIHENKKSEILGMLKELNPKLLDAVT